MLVIHLLSDCGIVITVGGRGDGRVLEFSEMGGIPKWGVLNPLRTMEVAAFSFVNRYISVLHSFILYKFYQQVKFICYGEFFYKSETEFWYDSTSNYNILKWNNHFYSAYLVNPVVITIKLKKNKIDLLYRVSTAETALQRCS